MTVAELIEKLQGLDPSGEMEVKVDVGGKPQSGEIESLYLDWYPAKPDEKWVEIEID